MDNSAQLIDEICDEFEASIREGKPLRIEDCLARVPKEFEAKLFRELLEIEIEWQTNQPLTDDGTNPLPSIVQSQKEFKERFPEHSAIVDSIVHRISRQRQIGDYEILGKLGHGGMGVVYRAKQKLLNQIVAIKVLPQSLLDEPQAVGRFLREMQLIGSLNHPNIVRALNAGEADGAHYLVMEYIDGFNLHKLRSKIFKEESSGSVKKPTDPTSLTETQSNLTAHFAVAPRFTVPAICEITRQAALGLQHAHEFGLVHRDIKPANLMIDKSGTVKILDLGLGKFLAEQRGDDSSPSLTQMGTTMGTVDYISPEQCENAGNVDIRGDIYSLGCTFYFLLTGHAPYDDKRYDTSRKKLMAHLVGEIPKLREYDPNIPAELDPIFQKMLAKDPKDRFQTPLELAEAIEPFSSYDDLLQMIGGRTDTGFRGPGGSTGKISGHSKTLVNATKPPYAPKSGRDMLASWLFIPAVGICIALMLPVIQWIRGPKDAGPQQAVSSAPDAVTAELLKQKLTIQTDLAQLPGLNGSWWFEETPWFLPFVREMVLKRIDESADPKMVLGDDLEYYYNPNILDVRNWLWKIVEKNKDQLPGYQFELVEKLKKIADSELDNVKTSALFQEALQSFHDNQKDGPPKAVEVHTKALLEHWLATLKNDRELALTANKTYEDALALYNGDIRKDENSPDAARKRRLLFLCHSDGARLEYLATRDYAKAIREFETVTEDRQFGEISPLFVVELRTAQAALCAASGQYNDSLFTRAADTLRRTLSGTRGGNRTHPLAAHIAERYAWSLIDQWKIADAEEQFNIALLIRSTNLRESGNSFASIYVFHNMHGKALTLRYSGKTDRAIEDYRKTLTEIDKALESLKSTKGAAIGSGVQRFQLGMKERAANTRERLADCTLYGGAASGNIGAGQIVEMARLYEEASKLYESEGECRTMRAKQAIALILQGEIGKGETIVKELESDQAQRVLLGNQNRTDLVFQVAKALLTFKKKTADGHSEDHLAEAMVPLQQFLRQFNIPSNPASSDGTRRETMELRFFVIEFLLNAELNSKKPELVKRDSSSLSSLLIYFRDKPESRPFIRRYCNLAIRSAICVYEAVPDSSILDRIIQLTQWMRFQDQKSPASPVDEETLPTLVVFFLTNTEEHGRIIVYPQDGRPGKLFKLPLARWQIKEGGKQDSMAGLLDPQFLTMIADEKKAGRSMLLSWVDTPSWARPEDALTESDWPFGTIEGLFPPPE